jgi:hypothetical protein
MKHAIALLLAAAVVGAHAQQPVKNTGNGQVEFQSELPVIRNQLGNGTPAPMITVGVESARYVDDNYYHTPQYMPMYPTAAVIWPRVIELECERDKNGVLCEGYHWLPEMGRGEYLFVVPKFKAPSQSVIVRETIREVPYPVLVERKKKKE